MSTLLAGVVATISLAAPCLGSGSAIGLAGAWECRLDPANEGREAGWAASALGGSMWLPGTTDQAGLGTPAPGPAHGHLTRPTTYTGAAWYGREITVPASWAGKHVELFLERCHWASELWLDGARVGECDSLSTPRIYDLSAALTPGKHRLAIRVDNTYRLEIGNWAHAITDETQTNWNGIVGRIELRASDPVRITRIVAAPDLSLPGFHVRVVLANGATADVNGLLRIRVPSEDGGSTLASQERAFEAGAGGESVADFELQLPSAAPVWEEWEGNLLRIEASFEAASGSGERYSGSRSLVTGLREFGARGSQFVLNGRPFLVRGNLECCIFPLTGHPPMEIAEWERALAIQRDCGLNNVRFHSWCPPEAAFVAADRLGMTLQVELPAWTSIGTNAAVDDFLVREGLRILDAYGNHPSFTMLCLGNELSGSFEAMDGIIEKLRAHDPRPMYTFSSDNGRFEPGPVADYLEGYRTKAGLLRIPGDGAHFPDGPRTDFDYRERIAAVDKPVIAHELGQWVTYPSYREIDSYTGVLKPRSLEGFREALATSGRGDRAEAFERASGQLAWRAYKEDIEAFLRTPGCGGFQLLSLQDFPGQYEALVGAYDSRWNPKGFLEPAEMRRFCGPTVPLARLPKLVWRANEVLTAEVELAHYGKEPLLAVPCSWRLTDGSGSEVAKGDLRRHDAPCGAVTRLGELRADLSKVDAPARLSLEVTAGETANSWEVWVYPTEIDESVPEPVRLATEWGPEVEAALAAGERVALFLPRDFDGEATVPTQWFPVFWSFAMFTGQPGTCGMLLDPQHPALAGFPSDEFSNWQWWELLQGGQCLDLAGLPEALRPIVEGIDDFHRNLRLAAVLECRVGEGRLLVSSLDLLSDLERRPVAAQLRRSLLDYAASDGFAPNVSVETEALTGLLRGKPPLPTVESPEGLDRAVLHVEAAALLATPSVDVPWESAGDRILRRAEGFDYAVQASGSWLDEVDSAWHGGRLEVTCEVPAGWEGTLYVRWADWNELGRWGVVSYGGASYRLGAHAGGLWSAFPVTAEQSADGRIEVSAECRAGPNLMVSDVALTPR